jgi:GTPase Era involved in 16S rRNA processing
LIRIADKKPWLLKEQLSSLSLEEKLEQILLEKILEYLHDEIPYHMDMKCTDIDYSDENHIKVQMSLFFENERHKRRFIGSQGETLIRIRQDFLSEAESLFKNKKLFVVFDMKLEK